MLALPPSTGVYSILCEFGLVSYPKSVRNFFFDTKCPNGEALEHFRMIIVDESEHGLKVMNGQGVYINTIDEPNVVIIPDHVIDKLK